MPKLRPAAATAALAAALIGIAVATHADRRAHAQAAAEAPARSTGPDSFAVFRRLAASGDVMPSGVRAQLSATAEAAGVDLDAARAVAASATGAVWAIPGPRQVCLAQPDPIDGFAINCAPIDRAIEGRLWTGLVGLPGQVAGDALIAILVPDDVATVTAVAVDGTTDDLTVADNVAFAAITKSAALTFDDSQGTTTVPVAGTPAELVAR